jgi:hypothetical protein
LVAVMVRSSGVRSATSPISIRGVIESVESRVRRN